MEVDYSERFLSISCRFAVWSPELRCAGHDFQETYVFR